jgi:hypothetical protein
MIMVAFFFAFPVSSTIPMMGMMFRSCFEEHQGEHGANARRRDCRNDRQRMDKAFV